MSGHRLGLTRVAYGCQSLAEIRAREPRLLAGGDDPYVVLNSRRIPRRDLAGGSVFWIVHHMLIARQPIIGIAEITGADGRPEAEIHLRPGIIPVVPRIQKSHQGWRYLAEELWPPDRAEDEELPPELLRQLGELSIL